jgi:hypothetical protein
MSETVVLTFFCPVSKGAVEWDTPHDLHTLVKQWSSVVRLSCPHCKGEHSFSFREAYVEAAIARLERQMKHPVASDEAH